MSRTTSNSEFQSLQNSSSDSSLAHFVLFTNSLYLVSIRVHFVVALFGVAVNVFHILVLTRKSMRTNFINVLMIGIATCDIYNLAFLIYDDVLNITYKKDECTPPSTLIAHFLDIWGAGIFDILRRLGNVLALLMATTRYITIKKAVNAKSSNLSQPTFAIKIIFVSLVLSTILTLFYWCHVTFEPVGVWQAAAGCSLNISAPTYSFSEIDWFWMSAETSLKIFNAMDGSFKILQTFLFPILSILLVRRLKLARKSSTTVKKDDQRSITKMVAWITALHVISEGPLGVLYIAQGFITEPPEMLLIFENLLYVCAVFVAVNTITHCVICLLVFSQYKKAIKEMFGCKKDGPRVLNLSGSTTQT